jgi:cyanophycinase
VHDQPGGHLVVIGGAEDMAGGSGLLRAFAGLAGGACARIVVVATASGTPGTSFDRYSAAFAELGVPEVRELSLSTREDADDDRTIGLLGAATGVFFTGGDQSRLGVLVGSRANRCLRDRLAESAVVIGGTSAGATVLGPTMITDGRCASGDHAMTVSRLRTGPGLGLLPGVIIDMHFAERRRFPRLLGAVLRQPSHLGVGIDEDTAIVVSPGRFDVLGRGAVTTVDARVPDARAPDDRAPDDRARASVRVHRMYAGRAFDLHQRSPDKTARPIPD